MNVTSKKLKVLVTGIQGNYGGTEAVVSRFMEVLSDRIQFDTFCYQEPKQPIFYTGDNTVIRALSRRDHPLRYAVKYRSFFRDNAFKYSAIWYNGNQFSNIVPIKLAQRCGIPKRVIHYHSTAIHGDKLTELLSELNRNKVSKMTTNRLACSVEAGRFAYGNVSFDVIHNAFNLAEYAFDAQLRDSARDELRIKDTFVVGNVGRLSVPKNQTWLVSLMPDILKCIPNARMLIVGDGELRKNVEKKVEDLRLDDKVIMVGARADIPRLLCACDVFAFPSLWEGLGVSAVEAQASGLPCVMSDKVPELAIVSNSATVLPLESRDEWVRAICSQSRETFIPDYDRLARYDIRCEAERLYSIFCGEA